jgi:hypothetical protein
MSPQTTIQILRCFTLGRYTACVVDGQMQIRGSQPLAGPLPTSIKARRDELIDFLNEWAGECGRRRRDRDSGRHSGYWPAAPPEPWMLSRRH